MWDKLSMADKAKLILLGVSNGITDLSTIRNTYNNIYALGGEFITPLEAMSKDYDNVGYFMDNSKDYVEWRSSPEGHAPDTFKTAYHPTFSKESKYSGIVDFVHNPKGIVGGDWGYTQYGSPAYRFSESQLKNGWDIDNTLRYIDFAEDGGVQVLMPDNTFPRLKIDDGEDVVYNGILPNLTVGYNSRKYGGYVNKFDDGGNKYGIPLDNYWGDLQTFVDTDYSSLYPEGTPKGFSTDNYRWVNVENGNKVLMKLGNVAPKGYNADIVYDRNTGLKIAYDPSKLYLMVSRASAEDIDTYNNVIKWRQAMKLQLSEAQERLLERGTVTLPDFEVLGIDKSNLNSPTMIAPAGYEAPDLDQLAWEHDRAVEEADALVRETAAFEKPLNFLSPGLWFGAGIDYLLGETDDILGSVYNGNSGWVTDNFAMNNPRAAALFNFAGDVGSGYVVPAFKHFSNPINNPIKNVLELGMYSSKGGSTLGDIIASNIRSLKDNPALFRRSLKYPFMGDGPAKTALANEVANYFRYNGLWHGNPNVNVSDIGFNPIRAGLYGDFGIMEPYVRTVQPSDVHYDYAVNTRNKPDMKIIDSPYEGYKVSGDPGEIDKTTGDIKLGKITDDTGYTLDAGGHWVRTNEDGTVQLSDVYKYRAPDYNKRYSDPASFMRYIKDFRTDPKVAAIKLSGKLLLKPLLKLIDANFNDFIYQSSPTAPYESLKDLLIDLINLGKFKMPDLNKNSDFTKFDYKSYKNNNYNYELYKNLYENN